MSHLCKGISGVYVGCHVVSGHSISSGSVVELEWLKLRHHPRHQPGQNLNKTQQQVRKLEMDQSENQSILCDRQARGCFVVEPQGVGCGSMRFMQRASSESRFVRVEAVRKEAQSQPQGKHDLARKVGCLLDHV